MRLRFVFAIVVLAGCKAAESSPEVRTDAALETFDESDVIAPSLAKPGDLTRCPVSDAVYRVRQDTPRVQHGGKAVYVCCELCKQRFEKAPAGFASRF